MKKQTSANPMQGGDPGRAGGATSGGHALCRVILFPLARRGKFVQIRPDRPEMGRHKAPHTNLPVREAFDADHQLSTRPAEMPPTGANEAVDGRRVDAEPRRKTPEGELVTLAVAEDRMAHDAFMRPRPKSCKGVLAPCAVVPFRPEGHNGAMARGRPKKTPAATTNRVLELRTKHGLTQQQLGDAVGHDSTWVYKVEAGKQSLTWENALLLGRLFGEEPGDLYVPSRRGDLGDLMVVARYLELMTPEERAAYALLAKATVVSRLPAPGTEAEPANEHGTAA